MKINAKDIINTVHERNITSLVHFTHPDNAETIREYGLLSRRMCSENQPAIYPKTNDPRRLDGMDGVCVSVSAPNHNLMLNYKKRLGIKDYFIV